jgi:hypothetical protein
MNSCDRLATVLAPDVLDALEALITEKVAAELARFDTARDNGPCWLTVEQAAERLGCSPGRRADARQPRQARHAASGTARVRLCRVGRRVGVSVTCAIRIAGPIVLSTYK